MSVPEYTDEEKAAYQQWVDERNAKALSQAVDDTRAKLEELRQEFLKLQNEVATQKQLLFKMNQFIGDSYARMAGSGPTVSDGDQR